MLRLAAHSYLAHRDAPGFGGTPWCGRTTRAASATTLCAVATKP